MSASGARAPGLRGVCVVAGVGPGNGVAISRLFAERGYQVAMLARREAKLAQWQREIPGARGYACDVTEAARVAATRSAFSPSRWRVASGRAAFTSHTS